MNRAQLQDFLDAHDTTVPQSESDPTGVSQRIVENIYLFVYSADVQSSPFASSLLTTDGSAVQKSPYLLTNFALQPIHGSQDLELELYYHEELPFGIVGKLIQTKISSVSQNEHLNELISGLKQRGDLKELSEDLKYLYKVGDLADGPVLTLTRSNSVFSKQAAKKASTEALKNDGRDLVEKYYRYIVECFDEGTGFEALNNLRKGFELSIEDGFLLKHLFDGFMSTLPPIQQQAYVFEKGSTDKLDFEIEIEKFVGGSLFKVPDLQQATGNFDWNHPHDFTSHHQNKAV